MCNCSNVRCGLASSMNAGSPEQMTPETEADQQSRTDTTGSLEGSFAVVLPPWITCAT